MELPIVVRPQAEADTLEARDWYDSRQDGLGRQFGQAVVALLERVATNPLTYPTVYGEVRRAVLSRFPYAIYFRLQDNVLVVLAVHGRQHPKRWQRRT